ncbi:hypothetical protein PMI17_02717, partial [Pantoea sp. GM01]
MGRHQWRNARQLSSALAPRGFRPLSLWQFQYV